MIALVRNDHMRCMECVVEWTGGPLDPCWSCGNTGITPWDAPGATVKVYWPSLNSPYTERNARGAE